MYQIYFLPSKNLQIQTTEHQLGSLMNINNIKDTVVRYNKAIENGKLNVKNLKRFELYPLSKISKKTPSSIAGDELLNHLVNKF